MTKWRNGTKDKSPSYKVLPFHQNLHLSPNLFCGLIATNKKKKKTKKHLQSQICLHGPFGNFCSSLSLLTGRRLTPRIFLIEMAALWEENDLFISYLPSSSAYDVMLWAQAIAWNGLWKLLTISFFKRGVTNYGKNSCTRKLGQWTQKEIL